MMLVSDSQCSETNEISHKCRFERPQQLLVAASLSGNALVSINVVALRRARLVMV